MNSVEKGLEIVEGPSPTEFTPTRTLDPNYELEVREKFGYAVHQETDTLELHNLELNKLE